MDDIYVSPRGMTSPGRFAGLFEDLPSDVGSLARVVQGLIVHEFLTGWYGFELPPERRDRAGAVRPARRDHPRPRVLTAGANHALRVR
jgi:hypothetical protein